MKNPAIVLLAVLLFPIAISAQPDLSNLPSVTIRLRTPDPAQTIFRHFIVLDERPDTTRIGLHTFLPTFGSPHNRQLVFRRPAAAEIAGWLNEQFSRPQAPYTALIVLRTLWLSDPNYLREDFVKYPQQVYERTHLHLKAEIYACRDSLFLPVLRYDTLLAYKNENIYTSASFYSHWGNDLTALLADLTDSASRLIPRREEHSRPVRLEEIREFNRSRADAPIEHVTSLTPGVYASFDEFRSNTPSIRDFEIKRENKASLLYIKGPDGASFYSHDAWGYSDGRSIFVMRDGFLCPVWKVGNAFYFYGGANKEITVPPGFIGIGRPGPGSNVGGTNTFVNSGQTLELKIHPIFTIDMDKGIVY